MTKSFSIKHDVNIKDLQMLTPWTLILLGSVVEYCYMHKLPCIITSITEDVDGRKSMTHKTGRAFDLSTRDWSKNDVEKICQYINYKHKDIGAISVSDYKIRPCVYHKIEGNAYHLHFQTRPME